MSSIFGKIFIIQAAVNKQSRLFKLNFFLYITDIDGHENLSTVMSNRTRFWKSRFLSRNIFMNMASFLPCIGLLLVQGLEDKFNGNAIQTPCN